MLIELSNTAAVSLHVAVSDTAPLKMLETSTTPHYVLLLLLEGFQEGSREGSVECQ